MSTLAAISFLLALLGVVPFLNSAFKIASSAGDVLLLFLLASRALSMLGSEERKVAGLCEMKAYFFTGVGLFLLRIEGEVATSGGIPNTTEPALEVFGVLVCCDCMTLNWLVVFGLILIGILILIGTIPGCGGWGATLIATGDDI